MHPTIESFTHWLFEEGRSPRTIESYGSDIKGFQLFLRDKAVGEDQPLSRFSFAQFKEQLMKENYAESTINKKINSLKVYNDFLISLGILTDTIVVLKRDRITFAAGGQSIVTILSEEEVNKLLFFVENRNKVSLRNKLIVYILLYTGVRVSELVNIKLTDIDYLTSHLQVVGKGGKWREIPLKSEVLVLLREYIKEERSASVFHQSGYLLVSQRAERMHRDAVRNWLEKISIDLEYKLHPHLFRRTFCTRLWKLGISLTTISKLSGHSSISTLVNFYIQTSREDKMDAVNRL